jgi:alkylation response protein AidB-like acyl-CoA dehydrogenase
MGHFRSDLRDLEFTLFEVLRVQDRMGSPPFSQMDEDTARDLLGEVNRMATGPLAAGFADADRHPPVFDPATGTVALPDSLRTAFQVLWDGEWWRLGLPAELGGYGVPSTVQWAAAELMLGANRPPSSTSPGRPWPRWCTAGAPRSSGTGPSS